MKGAAAKQTISYRLVAVVVALLFVAVGPFTYLRARADHLGQRTLMVTNNAPSAISTYKLSFTNVSSGTLGSVQFQVCTNDPFPGQPCTVPNGLNFLTATLTDQTGTSGFSIGPNSTANNLILSRTPLAAGPGPVSFTLEGVTNPSQAETYFVRLQTFASNDGTGPAIDSGGLAYDVQNNPVSIQAEVPPFLLFCGGVVINDNFCNSVSGNYINFGDLSSTATKTATTEMLVATNGASGYNIVVSGTTMTSGNNIIAALAANDVSRPGLSQFGLNLRANNTPSVGRDASGPGLGLPTANYNIPDRFRFQSGEVVARGFQPEDTRKYTVSYIVNISKDQPIGVYVTTLNYICMANF